MKISRVIRWAVFVLALLAIPAASFAGVLVQVTIAPPVLPVYVQPACPGDGYIWTPGYWAYGPDGYYWVPGTWVLAPEPGLLWTPGYWGWGGGFYLWHAGYWGPHIGFYGGVNYGFGYFGHGYEGGYWRDRTFYYNRSVNNVNITNVHIYNKTVVNNTYVNRVSYNGGRGGINARPGRFEETAAHERHFEATGPQMQHERGAQSNREFLASVNHGRPAVAATARPGEFSRGTPAREAGRPNRPDNRSFENRSPDNRGGGNRSFENKGGANRGGENRGPANRAAEIRGVPRPGNSDRGMQRNDSSANNRGGQQHNAAPEMRDRGDGRPRPNARPQHENAPRQENVRPQHENAPRQENARPQHENAPRGNREPHQGNGREGGPRH